LKIENAYTVRGFLLVFSLPPPVGKIHNFAKKEILLIDSFHIMSS